MCTQEWIEAFVTTSSTCTTVIEILCHIWFGLPEMIVSDNGPRFVSEEFESFLVANGVKRHIFTISPCDKWHHREGCTDPQEGSQESNKW